jgi:DeoR/GlpR family transcriptional regulator of sugar metabolism
MSPEDRRHQILSLVRDERRQSVDELATTFDTSRETIRRDLAVLQAQGLIRRLHGRAVPADGVPLGLEGPFSERLTQNAEAKRRIARKAAGLFAPGESLFVDTGSTTLAFASELAHRNGLTVLTNSAAIASHAARGKDCRAILLGGDFRRDGMECVGPATLEQIARFRPDHAVLTVAGITASGYADHDADEAHVARAMIAQAGRVTVLADSSKFGARGLHLLGPLAAARRIVTETAPAALSEALRKAGVSLLVADG